MFTGTGKTYVGLRIAQALLQNIHIWGHIPIGLKPKASSILIVCYTNHALDQFLEGILPFCQSIIRIGGKSKSPLLEHFNLKNVKACAQKDRKVPAYIFQNRKDCRVTLAGIQFKLSEYEVSIEFTTKKVLNDDLYDTIRKFDLLQFQSLGKCVDCNAIETWLGCNMENFGLNDQFDEVDQKIEEGEVNVDNNFDGGFEMDADEEEIVEIENMRCIDGDSDFEYENLEQINQRWSAIPENFAPAANDGFQIQRHQKKLYKNRIKQELKKTEAMTTVEAKTIRDIWKLSQQEKWNLYRFWRKLYVHEIEERIRKQRKKYANEWVRFNSLRNQEDIEIVQGHSIIGMTTTGAAKYHHIIDGIKPRIISKMLLNVYVFSKY